MSIFLAYDPFPKYNGWLAVHDHLESSITQLFNIDVRDGLYTITHKLRLGLFHIWYNMKQNNLGVFKK